jgi:hypothetical protein
MSLQFLLKVFPADLGCEGWSWIRQLTDFSHQAGTPSIYCLGDLTKGTPWISTLAKLFLCFVGLPLRILDVSVDDGLVEI